MECSGAMVTRKPDFAASQSVVSRHGRGSLRGVWRWQGGKALNRADFGGLKLWGSCGNPHEEIVVFFYLEDKVKIMTGMIYAQITEKRIL